MTSPVIQSPDPANETKELEPDSLVTEELDSSASDTAEEETVKGIPYELVRRQMAHCGEYTFQAMGKFELLNPRDTSLITQRYLKAINNTEKGTPFPDAIEFLAIEGWKKDELEARDVIKTITKSLIKQTKSKVSHLTFANQTDTPLEFYNDFPAVSEICRLLACPIIHVSEKDFLTVTSINPFTASAAASLILNVMEAEIGRKPFPFITTTDLEAWHYTCERHFGT